MEAAAEYSDNDLGFDDNNDAIAVTYQPDLDTDADHLAEAANITTAQAEAALVWLGKHYEQEIRHAAGDILARLITTIVPCKGRISLQVVALRFIACTFLLNRIGNESLTALAGRCGVSKQLLDFHAITVADRLGFHGFAQKRSEARAVYSQVQRESWSRLTPEERKARRAGKNNAQSATRNLTSSQETECEHTSQPPNYLGL
jgi:hypothetical protein